MLKNHLPHVSSKKNYWRKFLYEWHNMGMTSLYLREENNNFLCKIKSDSGWSAIINLQKWFYHIWPDAKKISESAYSIEQLKNLFSCVINPIDVPQDLLRYNKIIITNHEINESFFLLSEYESLTTPQGPLWLVDINSIDDKHTHRSLENLPTPLRIELGFSYITLCYIKEISPGDILLINNNSFTISIYGILYATYIRNEDFIMIDDFEYNNDHSRNEESEYDINNDFLNETINPRSKIPVKLTFSFTPIISTVSDIESLQIGDSISCPLDAENKINIHINNTLIAQGKLVWIDDHLGVELIDIYQDTLNAN